MPQYDVTIETNHGPYFVSWHTDKREAIKSASITRRTGGETYANFFERHEEPKVNVQNKAYNKSVYCKPLCQKALRKI